MEGSADQDDQERLHSTCRAPGTGKVDVAELLREEPILTLWWKNGLTPLHVAAHHNNLDVNLPWPAREGHRTAARTATLLPHSIQAEPEWINPTPPGGTGRTHVGIDILVKQGASVHAATRRVTMKHQDGEVPAAATGHRQQAKQGEELLGTEGARNYSPAIPRIPRVSPETKHLKKNT
ncbi:ankyrin-1a isoform X5 [Lates japonicus]|uniref:Ankyrin-1a isoform X5 n=1 Tax=Lates japonicus TaxID=270547 RepID=A0AAD3MGX1_LATJO|nr:ankyrin-1a isoform X5 [Lates japonicus]